MRSDTVHIDNSGKGFESAVEQTRKVAAYEGISAAETVQLQVLTEEMLSLARSVTGEMEASFWIEMEDGVAVMHMATQAALDRQKRAELIASSTSRKNEAAKTFLGKIRDMFEEAMAADPETVSLPTDILADLPFGALEEPEWDGYERSILKRMADEVKIGVQRGTVEITVSKRFGAAK